MVFLDKRIQVICDQLKKLSVKQKLDIPNIEYKQGKFLYPLEANKVSEDFKAFNKAMHWYGPDKHYWFKTSFRTPKSFEGKPLYLHIKTQIDEWDDAKNPQFLVFLNGEAVQGMDMNHRELLISNKAKPNEVYNIDMQAYTGTLHNEFSLIAELWEIDADITGLYYDLQVPLQAFDRMDKDSRDYMKLLDVLNSCINILDLRTPYSNDFYKSIKEAREYIHLELYTKLAGSSEIIASCIGHTHIDLAWWWTVEQTKEKVARSFSTVLKLMEEYPNYRFMSSQAQLYDFLKARYPELYSKIKKRVKEKRWEPEGGMWVEPDCNLTSGESLVRQFMYGKKFFKEEFGVDNKILWLPDVFGYSGALPQIMKKCGIDYFMTTKLAWNQFNKIPNDTFMWRGIDGSEVLTHLITTLGVGQSVENFFTTYNGMLHPDAVMGAWERYQNKNINNDVLISYGYGDGGGGPTREMLETSQRMEKGIKGMPRVRQCFALDYFKELDQRLNNNKRLATWEGELYFEYHRGTYTSMARNKRSNRKAEIAMMDLELISVLAEKHLPYPKADIDNLWKNILSNQFHDILPGSSIHEVYEVTKKEYEQIDIDVKTLINQRLEAVLPKSENVSIVNTKGFETSEIVMLNNCNTKAYKDNKGNIYPVQKLQNGSSLINVKGLKPKSYTVLTPNNEVLDKYPDFKIDNDGIITPYYIVKFDDNALIDSIFDIKNNREIIKKGEKGNLFKMFEDKPIYYDNWDIDIFYTEKYWNCTSLVRMDWIDVGHLRATLQIERQISNSTIKQNIHFYSNNPRIDFETTVDWKEHQHLLKVEFPLNIHSDEASFDIQFGNLTRKTHKNTSWDMARFEVCGQKWMDISEGHYGVSLLNDCKYGHSVHDSNIALTLIKSGIEPNPVADQEMHVFTYALYPHAGTWRQANTVYEAYKLNQPSLVHFGGNENDDFSLLSLNCKNVILETVKKAEDGEGFIIRLYESDKALTNAELKFNINISKAFECSMLEENINSLLVKDNTIKFEIMPYEVKTFRIKVGS